MPDDLEDNIYNNTKASGDAVSVEQHNLKDQIEADKDLASKRATQNKNCGRLVRRIIWRMQSIEEGGLS